MAVMTLVERTTPAKTALEGVHQMNVSAGQTIKIETTPGGVEVLNVVVPSGEVWAVNFRVHAIVSNV